MTNFVEMLKTKIEEANTMIKDMSPNLKDSKDRKQEIGKHIAALTQLMKDMEGKAETEMESFKEKVTEAIAAAEKVMKA